jgi:uncharacterized membrane protein
MADRQDQRMELVVSRVLRTGVYTSSVVVAIGGIAYLFRHAQDPAAYGVFHAQATANLSLDGIISAFRLRPSRSTIELGVILLVLTPVARVAVSLLSFAKARDRAYTIISAIVLTPCSSAS